MSEEREAWDSVAQAWRKWWRTFESSAQIVNDRLVELAEVGPGTRVLDIATGIGEPAVTAARRGARVTATDFSPRMIQLASERARAEGVDVEFAVADAEKIDFADMDAVLSRWGLMLMPDPSRVAARVRGVLRDGGKFALSVWRTAEQVPALALAYRVLVEQFGAAKPDPDEPGPFRLGEPGALAAVLEGAGFRDIDVTELEVTMRFASPEEYVAWVTEMSKRMQRDLDERSEAERSEVLRAIARAAGDYRVDGGVAFSNRVWCGVASR